VKTIVAEEKCQEEIFSFVRKTVAECIALRSSRGDRISFHPTDSIRDKVRKTMNYVRPDFFYALDLRSRLVPDDPLIVDIRAESEVFIESLALYILKVTSYLDEASVKTYIKLSKESGDKK